MSGHRFRHVSRKSGTFVLAASLLILAVGFMTARAQRWFERTVPFQVEMPQSGSSGLRSGSNVELLGTIVGSVDDIWIDEADVMWARIDVREDFARFVRSDSTCVIRKATFGIAGDAYVALSRGFAEAPLAPDAKLQAQTDSGLTDEVNDLIGKLSREIEPTVAEVRTAVREYTRLAQSLQDPDGRAQQILTRLENAVQQIVDGQGIAGRVLKDPSWGMQVDSILENLKGVVASLDATAASVARNADRIADDAAGTTKSVNALLAALAEGDRSVPAILGDFRELMEQLVPILEDLQRATATLPEIAETARDEVRALPGLLRRSQQTLIEVERLVVGAQQNWLLAPYMPREPATERLGGEGLGGSDR